jgi:hypothetical protein
MRSSANRSTPAVALYSLTFAVAFSAPITASAQYASLTPIADADVPKPAVDLKPGTFTYNARLESPGRTTRLDVTHTVKSEKGTWVVNDSMTIFGILITDRGTMDKRTLLLRKQVTHSGPNVTELQFAGNRATGIITDKGQKRSIDMDTGGALYADGPGAQDAIAALPLANAYTTSFRNFDADLPQGKLLQLRVMGTDTVTVPAGTFQAWKVLVTSANGDGSQTSAYWVDKTSRRVVKTATTFPGLRGVIGTMELVK